MNSSTPSRQQKNQVFFLNSTCKRLLIDYTSRIYLTNSYFLYILYELDKLYFVPDLMKLFFNHGEWISLLYLSPYRGNNQRDLLSSFLFSLRDERLEKIIWYQLMKRSSKSSRSMKSQLLIFVKLKISR